MLCHLNDLTRVEDYLRVVGRLHDSAGVEIAYLAITGDAFCTSLKVSCPTFKRHMPTENVEGLCKERPKWPSLQFPTR